MNKFAPLLHFFFIFLRRPVLKSLPLEGGPRGTKMERATKTIRAARMRWPRPWCFGSGNTSSVRREQLRYIDPS